MKKILLIITISLFTLKPALAHDPSGMAGFNLGAGTFFDDTGVGYTTEFNATLIILNADILLKLKPCEKPDKSIYLGTGFANVLQIQYGTNFSQNLLRFKTIIPFKSDGRPLWSTSSRDTFWGKVSLNINYTFNLDDDKLSNFGLGLYFNI